MLAALRIWRRILLYSFIHFLHHGWHPSADLEYRLNSSTGSRLWHLEHSFEAANCPAGAALHWVRSENLHFCCMNDEERQRKSRPQRVNTPNFATLACYRAQNPQKTKATKMIQCSPPGLAPENTKKTPKNNTKMAPKMSILYFRSFFVWGGAPTRDGECRVFFSFLGVSGAFCAM